ncbi:MAG: PTS sugar transporter subunit IIA [Betaproteobacteria bacterium]|jgi:PTS system mannose-specific IIA component|nr:PTS sugar transporter subunit IIA [Betaproteobacteria bacterium]
MIGVLILAHGNLGTALLASASHMLGREPENVRAIGVSASDAPESILARGRAALRELDTGNGVLVLTDIYGATPCNVASRLLKRGQVEGVSGVSLPMLLRVLTYSGGGLDALVEKARSGGTEGVVHLHDDCCSNAER